MSIGYGSMSNRLDRLPISGFHYKLLRINGFAWAFDAFDTGLITFVVAALAKVWQLNTGQISLILSIGLAGMFLGAIGAGRIADRLGRKTVFQITMLLFAISSILCAISWNWIALLVFRFLVGVGLGGETPVVNSVMGEFIPAESRGKVQGLINTFWALGWLASAVISFFVIPTLGWRWAFIVGALPAFYVWVIRRNLPESPRWLVKRGRLAEAEAIVSDMETRVSKELNKPLPEPVADARDEQPKDHLHVGFILDNHYLRRTIMFWILWFMAMFGYYGLFSWMPTLFVKAGHTMMTSFFYVFIMQLAYVPNQILSAYLMDRVGRKWLLTINLFLAGIATVAYGWALGHGVSTLFVVTLGVFASFFISAIWAITYTYTTESYPTEFRATGIGAASAWSRIGSLLAPLIVGYSLASMGTSGVFMIVAFAFIIAGFVIAILGVETKGKKLDTI
ncbi:Major facilitator superfamily transporter [Acididesulfobacillus acetoxydans]|uniref:Major facilitator superfamily transporter n=1 Tax=Acididesulfobacillus acetoxydans TaxID=1561005 RepID=A0A8S0Y2H7_9FIRM|nr:MFS transporter [Acididesulfobacillus acetoxydans]CAA7600825.1 Major facilitator superfamily transporter [Acididesulfobacillus acetoxydans]CEJ09246.1 Synaptic vesicle 2-related protein [Acididesulfobacillus acetoxydans]